MDDFIFKVQTELLLCCENSLLRGLYYNELKDGMDLCRTDISKSCPEEKHSKLSADHSFHEEV